MDSKLVRFFNKIGLKEEEYSCFSGAKLENVIVDNNDQSWSLLLIYYVLKVKTLKKLEEYTSFLNMLQMNILTITLTTYSKYTKKNALC